jgi:hypothetical protein
MRARRIVLAALVLLAAACSPTSETPAVSSKPSPTPSPAAAAPQQLCFADPPSDWALAMSNAVASLDRVNFGLGAVDEEDRLAFGGTFGSGSTIASVDLLSGKVQVVGPMASNGFGWMTYADGWLVWPLVWSGGSSIQAWSTRTHELRQIATALPGTAAVGHGYVVWTQPTNDRSSDMRVYRLATGRITTVDSGILTSPVFAGNFLVWAKQAPGDSNPSFVFADAETLRPVAVPPELRAPRQIGNLAGSTERLVWTGTPETSSPDSGTWFVDDLASGSIKTYGARNHYFQFPQLAGRYLVWFGADKNSIVDLRSGNGFDIPLPGYAVAAGDTIVVVRLSTLRGNLNRSDVSVLHPSQLSPLGPCIR